MNIFKTLSFVVAITLATFTGHGVSAQTCGKFCDHDFWKSASQADVLAEISKVNVNARTEYGRTALMYAAGFGTPEHLRVLLDAGADASIKNSDGNTAWDLAQENESLKDTDASWMLNDLRFK